MNTHHLYSSFLADSKESSNPTSQPYSPFHSFSPNIQKFTPAQLSFFYQQSELCAKRSPGSDFATDLMKRTKHDHNAFTQTNVKVETFEEDHANESRISKVEDQYLEQKQIRQPINYNERERIMQAHYSRLKESLERTASENVTHHSVQPEELTQSEALELMKRRQFEQFRKQQMMQHFYKQYLQYAEQNSNKDWLQQHQNREGKGQRLQQYENQRQQFMSYGQETFIQQIRQRQEQMLQERQKANMTSPYELYANNQRLHKLYLRGKMLYGQSSTNQSTQSSGSNSSPIAEKLEDGDGFIIKEEHVKMEEMYQKFEEPDHVSRQIWLNTGLNTEEQLFYMNRVERANVQNNEKKKKSKNTKSELTSKTKRQKGKKKSGNSDSQSYVNSIVAQSLSNKEAFGPRRKNKWQIMVEQTLHQQGDSNIKDCGLQNLKILDSFSNIKDNLTDPNGFTGIGTNSDEDFLNMLFLTIKRDPLKKSFVVAHICEENPVTGVKEEPKLKKIQISSDSQARIPEIGCTRLKPRKQQEPLWNPQAIPEDEIKAYFTDLHQSLNCQNINEERALKLLKRKNFKREKVKVNISKNEKFYSTFLVTPTIPTEPADVINSVDLADQNNLSDTIKIIATENMA